MALRLFDRRVVVTIHRLQLSGVRIAFQVERSLKKDPNTCELRLWNLNEDHQKALQEQGVIPVILQAGYAQPPLSTATEAALADIDLERDVADLPVIYQGELRRAWTSREGSDWVTTIRSGDGERQRKRVQLKFKPGLRWRQMLRKLAEEAGVGLGNALDAIGGVADIEISTGVSLTGDALGQLDRMLAGVGFEVSVQDGQLQVLGAGEPLRGTAVELSEATGLVDSPEPGSDGHVELRALLQPGLEPGRRIYLKAKRVEGYYRVQRWTAIGDTHGQDWYAEVEVKELRA